MKRYVQHRTPWVPLLILLLSAAESRAQTIETLPLERTMFCVADSITVRFRVNGDSWKTFNEFVVEVSLPDGTFGSGTRRIGSLRSVAPDEVEEVGAVIPDDLDPNGRYRIRVSSTRPPVSGTDNGQDVRIVPLAILQFGLPATIWITGQQMGITSYISGAARVEWDFGEGAIPASSDQLKPPPIRFQTPGRKTISVTATNEAGCTSTLTTTLDVNENHPRIPANASVGRQPSGKVAHMWVCPDDSVIFWGGENNGLLTIYIESGGTVVIEHSYVDIIAYVKRYGNLTVRDGQSSLIRIIHEDQAFLDLESPLLTFYVEADSIGFDYSEAPAGGCNPQSGVVGADLPHSTDGSAVQVIVHPDGSMLEGTVRGAGVRITDVSLYDIRGKRLLTQEYGTDRFTLPLPDLPPGPFLVVLNTTAGVLHRRIVVP